MIEQNRITRIYFDSNVFIYAIEGTLDLVDALQRLVVIVRSGRAVAVTSELTLAEVLAKADQTERRNYLSLIVWSVLFELIPVSRDVLVETARYRQVSGMPKLADSIHIVTAIQQGCEIVLSGDQRIKLPAGMSLIDASPSRLSKLILELS